MFQSVLIPTDGSPESERAVRYGVRLAKSSGARITILHVERSLPVSFAYAEMAIPWPVFVAEASEEEKAREADALDEARKIVAEEGVDADLRTVADPVPYPAILREADACDADLIVVGSKPTTLLGALLEGSQSAQVATRAQRPVLVVH